MVIMHCTPLIKLHGKFFCRRRGVYLSEVDGKCENERQPKPFMPDRSCDRFGPRPERLEDQWVWQKEGSEIGHMIALTPMLKAIAELTHQPVPVYFDTQFVREMFLDATFIRALPSKPSAAPMARTDQYGTSGANVSDFYFRHAQRAGFEGPMPSWYVDQCGEPPGLPARPRIAVVHGARWVGAYGRKKAVPEWLRSMFLTEPIRLGYSVILLGADRDRRQFWQNVPMPPDVHVMFGQPIRDAIGALQTCEAVLCNDTGLSHVACASGLPTYVFGMSDLRWQNGYPTATYIKAIKRSDAQIVERLLKGSVANVA